MTKLEQMREKTISSQKIFDGKVIQVVHDEVELPNGKHAMREVVHHCLGACILALNEKNEVIVEEQYRYPYDEVIMEFPAGKGNPGEDALVTATRELEEETGYHANHMEKLGEFYPSVGYTDEVIHLFLATDLVKTHQKLDEDENLNFYFESLDTFIERVKRGEIKDGKTVAALSFYLLKKQK